MAVAASVAIHLVIASVVHSNPVEAQSPEKPAPITVIKLPPPTPTPPPPTPPPHVQRQQHSSHAVRPAVHVPKQHSTNNKNTRTTQNPPDVEPTGIPAGGDVDETPAPVETEQPPIPTPTPKPACSAPDVAARAIDAVSPQAPTDAPAQGALAKVKVDLDATGHVVGTSIYESTGYQELDHAALDAARRSRYAPEEKNCKNVGGSYLFTVNFSE